MTTVGGLFRLGLVDRRSGCGVDHGIAVLDRGSTGRRVGQISLGPAEEAGHNPLRQPPFKFMGDLSALAKDPKLHHFPASR